MWQERKVQNGSVKTLDLNISVGRYPQNIISLVSEDGGATWKEWLDKTTLPIYKAKQRALKKWIKKGKSILAKAECQLQDDKIEEERVAADAGSEEGRLQC